MFKAVKSTPNEEDINADTGENLATPEGVWNECRTMSPLLTADPEDEARNESEGHYQQRQVCGRTYRRGRASDGSVAELTVSFF